MPGKLARLDWPLFLTALGLCAVGLLNVYSGTRVFDTPGVPLVAKQAIWLALGIAVFFVFYLMNDGLLEEISVYLFAGTLILLLAVLILGKARGGAQRWISMGGFNLQPSEFAKIAVILVLARFYAEKDAPGGIGLRELVPAAGIIAVPFLLVAMQPDLGTAGIFVLILAGMTVVACVRGRVLVLIAGLGLGAIPGLWHVMRDYQRQRVLTLLDPERDPLGAGYHVIQSKIAVGSGGVIGKGYLHGTQGSLRFLPEQHTDFAFAVFAEEWGFLGALVLLALYFALIHRCFWLASNSRTRFTSFACAGITVFFLAHAVINIAMVCGLFPVVGIPLPFVSYGGSSMVTNMMALGIVANLSRTRFTFQGGGERPISD